MELIHSFNELLTRYKDPRVQNWPFMDSGFGLSTITVAYVYFVYIGGPQFMKDKKPYNIKTIIKFYNLMNILFSAFFCYQFAVNTYFGGGYSFFCQGADYHSQESFQLLKITWWYLFVRIADLLDTIFFVLMKKYSHITALHVSHHVIVIWNFWIVGRHGCVGQNMLTPLVNSFVHVIMYTYYFLSLLGPSVKPYLWWRKYLTQIQLTQFFILFFHGIIPIFYDCGFPRLLSYLILCEALYFFYMFYRFYKARYDSAKRKRSMLLEQKGIHGLSR